MRRAGVGVALGLALLAGVLPAAHGSSHAPVPLVITVSEVGGLRPETRTAVAGVAEESGTAWAVHHTGTLQLLRVTRGDEVVQAAPEGYRYPMSVMAVDPRRAAPILGPEVAAALRAGDLVMGAASAALRGAQAGDLAEVIGWDGGTYLVRVGAVVPDARIGWAEMAFSEEAAAAMGFVRESYVTLWGFPDGRRLVRALEGSMPEGFIRIRSPEEPRDRDAVLPSALLKQWFGEFAYRPTGPGDRIQIEAAWVEENIVSVEYPVLGPFRCHRRMLPFLEQVMGDLLESGSIHQIDHSDFQIAGGCYNPRLIRGGDKGGAVSRHAWGAAIDVNPSRNPYGGRVAMSDGIVDSFHRWGFAWGGGWTYPDGGHFEWSGIPGFLLVP